MQRTKETGLASELERANMRILDQAEVPRGPISPNVPRDIEISLMTSLVFAVGLAFLLEHFDNRIRTPEELKAHLGVPFLGMVPVAKAPAGARALEAAAHPLLNNGVTPNFVEAFKTLRTNVLFSSSRDGVRSVVVTSAGPGEGKSVVAANTALALAMAGQRVLSIDADMRRPRINEIFRTPQAPGLSNVLTGNAKTSESIRKTTVQGLWLLELRRHPTQPVGAARLLALRGPSRRLRRTLRMGRHRHAARAGRGRRRDCRQHATGVIFVVGSDKTSRHAARAAIEQLDAASAHIIGAVLNNVDLDGHPHYYAAYYRKEYAKYYTGAR